MSTKLKEAEDKLEQLKLFNEQLQRLPFSHLERRIHELRQEYFYLNRKWPAQLLVGFLEKDSLHSCPDFKSFADIAESKFNSMELIQVVKDTYLKVV